MMETGSGSADSTGPTGGDFRPKILIFSTEMISDIGIDLAGSSHMHYPTSAIAIRIPCSSSIRPEWVLYALQHGFDGVFIAADGTDCPHLPDCTKRTAMVADKSQKLLQENGIDPSRLKIAAVCSVCAEPFVKHTNSLYESLKELGPAGLKN